MTVICAWCGKPLGYKPPYDDRHVSDGICEDCTIRVLAAYTWKRRHQAGHADSSPRRVT